MSESTMICETVWDDPPARIVFKEHYGWLTYVPEHTCEDISAEYGKFVCGKCGCVVHDTSVIDNGGLNHCPDCGSVVGE